MLAREVGGDREGRRVFGEEAAGYGGVLDVVGIRIGADESRRSDILVALAVRRCYRARDWWCRRDIGGGLGERLEGELEGTQGAECRDRCDVPGRVIDNDGLIGKIVGLRVDSGHLCVRVWRRRRRAQVPSPVVVVRSIFHAPGGGGGRSRRVW